VARALAAAAPKGQRKAVFDEARRTAMTDAKGHPKVTAEHIRKTAEKMEALASAKSEAETGSIPVRPWDQFKTEVLECVAEIKAAIHKLNRVLDGNKAEKRNRAPYAHFIQYQSSIGLIHQAIHHIESNVPGDAGIEKPYYIPQWAADERASRAKGDK
jgi:hypothetical protein